MSNRTVCDRCSKEGTDKETKLWWSLARWPMEEDDYESLDFCSIECLFWWAASRMPSPFERQEKS